MKHIGSVLSVIGVVIGLIGITLAVHYHSQSIQERVPTFYVEPVRAKIFDATGQAPSELQVLHRGRAISERSVTAVQIYFWNEGELPIRKADILEPLAIELWPPAEILAAHLVKQSRKVINFSLGAVPESTSNRLPLSFDILEKSDGAAIQIIFAGEPDAPVALKGTIVGVGAPKLLSLSKGGGERPNPLVTFKLTQLMRNSLLAIGVVALLLIGALWLAVRRRGQKSVMKFGIFVIVTAIFFGIFWGMYMAYDAEKTSSTGVPSGIWLTGESFKP